MNVRSSLEIVPVSPETWPLLEELFSSGGDPRWCWCMWWRMRSKEFSAATVAELRGGLHGLVAGPEPPGLVAVDDDRAIGWVSLGPRTEFARLERSRVIPRVDDQPVWSIVCFAVSPDVRGQGVASRLLAGAVAWARDRGARVIEAYPVDARPPGRMSCDAAFTGTLDMFLRAGFEVVGPTSSSSAGRPRVIVRTSLGEASD